MKKHTNNNDVSLNLEQTSQQNLNNSNSKDIDNKPKKKIVWKIFRIFFKTILLIHVLIVVFSCTILVVETMASSNSFPVNLEYMPCVERYGLMEPEIQKGDLIIIKKTDTSELNEGDVIAYYLDGNDSIGRIISISSSGLNIKADRDEMCNEIFIPLENIQGKWNGVRIPIVGWIILFVQNSWWILIIIPCLIEMFVILGNLLRKSSSRKIQNKDDRTIKGKGAL